MTKRILKLMMLMGVLAMSLTFVACGGDDDDTLQITKKDIVGKWVYEKKVIFGEEDLYEFSCPEKKDYREFKEDGTILSVEYSSDCEINNNNQISESWKLENGKMVQTETYTYSDKTVRKYKYVYSIKEITKSTMGLLFLESYTNGKKDEIDLENKDGKDDEVLFYYKRFEE